MSNCFDFKKNWHLVLPHLHSEAVENALDYGLKLYYLQSIGSVEEWKSGDAPWKLDNTGIWDNRIERKMKRDFPGWQEKYKHPSDLKFGASIRKLNGCSNDYPLAYYAEEEKIRSLCSPKKDTLEYYQAYDKGYYLSGWQGILGRKLFPDYRWFVVHKVIEFQPLSNSNQCVTLVIGLHPHKKIFIIFDILNFTKTPAKLLKKINHGFVFSLDEWTDSVAQRVNEYQKPKSIFQQPTGEMNLHMIRLLTLPGKN